MVEFLISNIEAVAEFVIGIVVILFRKQIIRLNSKMLKRAKSKDFEELKEQMKDFLPYFLKFEEICFIVFGVICIVLSLNELFFPAARNALDIIPNFLALFMLALFSFCGAAFIMYKVFWSFLWRKVLKHMKLYYPQFYQKLINPSITEQWKLVKSRERVDDPILSKLRRNSIISTLACFVLLFVVIFIGLYTLVRATS